MFFAFDENVHTLFGRVEKMGMDFKTHVESGLLTVRQIDPAEIAPGELANRPGSTRGRACPWRIFAGCPCIASDVQCWSKKP